MNSRHLQLGLVAVNVILAAWLIGTRPGRAPAPPATAQVPPSLPAAETQPAPLSPWSHLKSGGLKQYVARLRSIQCPEETVQDIIISEVNRLYASKEAALVNPSDRSGIAFVTGDSRHLPTLQRIRELRLEKQALIRDLVGVNIPADLPDVTTPGGVDRFDAALESLPQAKRTAARAVHQQFQINLEALRRKVDDLYLPEDVAEYRRLLAQRTAELAAILSPTELDEVEFQSSVSAERLRQKLGAGFEPTEAELRALFKLQKTFDETFELPGQVVGDNGVTEGAAEGARSRLNDDIKQALGETRYKEYARSQDWNYRNLALAAKDLGLARDVADRGFEIITAAKTQFGSYRNQTLANPALSPEQRNDALRQYQAYFEQQLKALYGDKGFEQIRPRLPRFGPITTPR